ncbi:MAG: response regulator [Thermodesulfobacteriota bacterium]|nr:response regulator [Thermodesulfobacteriota bacterium]
MLKKRNIKKLPEAVIISDSKAVQKVYNKILFSNGFNPLVFDSIQKAFEAVTRSKPELVITELFLDEISGLELSKEIRKFYSVDEVPIIVSTRQKDFIDKTFKKKCFQSGVNDIVKFPITSMP